MKIKALLFFILLPLTCSLQASTAWKMVARTIDCPKKVLLEAREGERSLRAHLGHKQFILYPQGNYGYSSTSAITLIFDSHNRRDKDKKPHIKYIKNGMASGRSDVLLISLGAKNHRCDLKAIK